MEVRRSMCPQNKEEYEPASIWWLVYFIIPIMAAVSFAIKMTQQSATNSASGIEDYLRSIVQREHDTEKEYRLWTFTQLEFWWSSSMFFTLFLMNSLFFRYVLFYFPQQQVLTVVVRRVLRTLFGVFFLLCLVVVALTILLYAMFSANERGYRTPSRTALSIVSFVQGSFADSDRLQSYGYSLLWILGVLFFSVALMLKNTPIALFVSHGK